MLQYCVYLASQDSFFSYLYNYLSHVSQPAGGCLQLPLEAKSAAMSVERITLFSDQMTLESGQPKI